MEVFWKATAGVVSAAFAVAILAGDRSRSANRFLAFFLVLIAGNQIAETFRAMATDPATQRMWLRIAAPFAFLDPYILFCFASVFPEENRLHRPRWLLLAAAPLLVLVPGVFVLEPRLAVTPESHLVSRTWATYTVLLYLVALSHFLHRFATDGHEGSKWMVAAMCVVTLPTLERLSGMVTNDLSALLTGGPHPDAFRLISLVAVPLLAAGVLCKRVCPRASPRGRRWMGTWLVVGALFTVVAKLPVFVESLAAVTPLPASFPGESLYSATAASWRWLAFGSLVSAAIARDVILDMSLRSRVRAARTLVGGWLVTLVAALGLAAQHTAGRASPELILGLGLAAFVYLAVGGFQRTVELTARYLFGLPDPDRPEERLAVFQRGVDEVLARGDEPDEIPELERLRQELGLDNQAACLARRMVTSPDGPARPGDLVGGRYRVQTTVGTGSLARALLARDEVLDREVVLKEVFHEPGEEVGRREAQLAAAVRHPNVLTVHDVIERADSSVLVTEYVPAGTLADRLGQGAFGPDQARAILDSLLAGLAAVHEEGIVHRDLKPANVLLVDDTTPMIADFGTARSAAGEPSPDGCDGTPAWMAPEQRQGGALTPRTDIYAVGAIGRAITDAPPDRLATVLAIAMAPEPADRWASADEMREALRRPRSATITERSNQS